MIQHFKKKKKHTLPFFISSNPWKSLTFALYMSCELVYIYLFIYFFIKNKNI